MSVGRFLDASDLTKTIHLLKRRKTFVSKNRSNVRLYPIKQAETEKFVIPQFLSQELEQNRHENLFVKPPCGTSCLNNRLEQLKKRLKDTRTPCSALRVEYLFCFYQI